MITVSPTMTAVTMARMMLMILSCVDESELLCITLHYICVFTHESKFRSLQLHCITLYMRHCSHLCHRSVPSLNNLEHMINYIKGTSCACFHLQVVHLLHSMETKALFEFSEYVQ